ncbi:MAG: 50S ribosomal protein L19e [Candidatus Hecatellaceae archaeon]
MNLKSQRRIAAQVLKVGVGRVWIDPERMEDVASAITRQEVERLIKEGAIRAKPEKGVSRGRAREKHRKRKQGRRRGPGSREGAAGARAPKKRRWVTTIRAIRKVLKELRDSKAITTSTYRRLYTMAKGGVFKSKSQLLQYVRSSGLLAKRRGVLRRG